MGPKACGARLARQGWDTLHEAALLHVELRLAGRISYPAAVDRPIGVLGYHRNVEFAWHGIGSWLA